MISSYYAPPDNTKKIAVAFAFVILIAGLVAFMLLRKKSCDEFECPDGKVSKVNAKGNSEEECCVPAPIVSTPSTPENNGDDNEGGGGGGGKNEKNVGMIVGAV